MQCPRETFSTLTSEQGVAIKVHPGTCVTCGTQLAGPLGHLEMTCMYDDFTWFRNLIIGNL